MNVIMNLSFSPYYFTSWFIAWLIGGEHETGKTFKIDRPLRKALLLQSVMDVRIVLMSVLMACFAWWKENPC